MHPVIRVLAFLSLVALLSRATLFFILALDVLFLILSAVHLRAMAGTIWRSVVRLRWLWLSLLLLYSFMGPVAESHGWQFSNAGLLLGLERCLALLTVIVYFSLLNHVTTREELQAAIYWLLAPLRIIGVPAERISLRISLTMHAVAELQQQFERGALSNTSSARNWRQLPQRIYDLFHHALAQVDRQGEVQVISLKLEAPAYGQWLYLLAIISVLVIGLKLLSV